MKLVKTSLSFSRGSFNWKQLVDYLANQLTATKDAKKNSQYPVRLRIWESGGLTIRLMAIVTLWAVTVI